MAYGWGAFEEGEPPALTEVEGVSSCWAGGSGVDGVVVSDGVAAVVCQEEARFPRAELDVKLAVVNLGRVGEGRGHGVYPGGRTEVHGEGDVGVHVVGGEVGDEVVVGGGGGR